MNDAIKLDQPLKRYIFRKYKKIVEREVRFLLNHGNKDFVTQQSTTHVGGQCITTNEICKEKHGALLIR